jgi:hypothetical protein
MRLRDPACGLTVKSVTRCYYQLELIVASRLSLRLNIPTGR